MPGERTTPAKQALELLIKRPRGEAHDRSAQQGRHEGLQHEQATHDQNHDRGELRDLFDSFFQGLLYVRRSRMESFYHAVRGGSNFRLK